MPHRNQPLLSGPGHGADGVRFDRANLLVYVLRAPHAALTAQLAEVSAVRWVPLGAVAGLEVPPELPSLIAEAARWAKDRWWA